VSRNRHVRREQTYDGQYLKDGGIDQQDLSQIGPAGIFLGTDVCHHLDNGQEEIIPYCCTSHF
jgi:hypothetical protein